MSHVSDRELYADFRAHVRESFRFLENEFGFRLVGEEEEPPHGTHVTFANDTTGVKIDLQPREGYLTTYLIELIDGEVPSYLDYAGKKYVGIDRIAELETGKDEFLAGDLYAPAEVRRMVDRYARMVREHGEPILRGDFTRLREANARELSEEELFDVGLGD